jgi:hypothetical protein
LTPDVSGYVFRGKPTTFQGSLKNYEFSLGQGLSNAAKMIYPQAFSQLRLLDQVPFQGDSLAIVPSIEHFEFRFGGTWTPVMYATVKLNVKLLFNGRQVHQNSYEIKEVKEGTHSLFPTRKQQYRAISTALIETLKMSATEMVNLHAVHALFSERSMAGTASQGEGPGPSGGNRQVSGGRNGEAASGDYSMSDETRAWIAQNQYQIVRSENQAVRNLLPQSSHSASSQNPSSLNQSDLQFEAQDNEEDEAETSQDASVAEEESTYVPLPGPYAFVPTELEKKQWAARKAEMELRRAEREAEEKRLDREYKMDLVRINEKYAKQLNDGTWIYNNAVSEAIIDHGENVITAGKVVVATAACVGPQAAATCAPVAGAMVSYGRFDSLAKGIGEGTAEYQRSGDFNRAVTTGIVSGGVDQLSGMAGGALTKNKLVRDRFGTSADIVRKRAFKKTQSATTQFIPGRADLGIKTHIYKAEKVIISEGLETFAVQGLGAEAGKKIADPVNKRVTRYATESVGGLDQESASQPEGRVLGEDNE